MKLSVHKNIRAAHYGFECPYCGHYIREKCYNRYHERTDSFCECGSHYVIYWVRQEQS